MIRTAFLLCIVTAASVHALPLVRATSMGGAYRAMAASSDIVFYNPAGLLKNRRTSADIDYLTARDQQKHSLSVSIMDASTADWGMGMGYSASISGNAPTAHEAIMAFAIPLFGNNFSLGTSITYEYDAYRAASKKHFFNMNVGILAVASESLSFAIVLDQFLAEHSKKKPMAISFGTAVSFLQLSESLPLTMAIDWSMNDVSSDDNLAHVLGFGVEYIAMSVLPVRVGYQACTKESDHFLSLGIGIISENFSIDGVYQQHLTIGKHRQFGAGLRISF